MIIDDWRGDDAYWMHIMHFVRYKNDVTDGENRGVSMHVVLRPSASAHSQGRECGVAELSVRSRNETAGCQVSVFCCLDDFFFADRHGQIVADHHLQVYVLLFATDLYFLQYLAQCGVYMYDAM